MGATTIAAAAWVCPASVAAKVAEATACPDAMVVKPWKEAAANPVASLWAGHKPGLTARIKAIRNPARVAANQKEQASQTRVAASLMAASNPRAANLTKVGVNLTEAQNQTVANPTKGAANRIRNLAASLIRNLPLHPMRLARVVRAAVNLEGQLAAASSTLDVVTPAALTTAVVAYVKATIL